MDRIDWIDRKGWIVKKGWIGIGCICKRKDWISARIGWIG